MEDSNDRDDRKSDAVAAKESPTTGSVPSPGRNSSALFDRLAAGFRAIKARRDHRVQGLTSSPNDTLLAPVQTLVNEEQINNNSDGSQAAQPDFLSQVLVNVIDPSSTPSVVSPSKGRRQPTAPPLQLYEKLEATLEKHYHRTLRQVPYQSPMTGATSVIDSLTVQTVVTRSHGGVLTSGADAEGTPDAALDPTEWHRVPHCHVYLATCENLEQYRTKIKPSIQVFLSQIEANSNDTNTGTGSSHSATSTTIPCTSSQYVIAFVPTSRLSSSSTSSSAMVPGEGGTDSGAATGPFAPRARISHFASRVAAARQMARETITASVSGGSAALSTAAGMDASSVAASDDLPDDATASTAGMSDPSQLGSSVNSTGSGGSGATTSHLSKADKELARRFAIDFPAGSVCILSSLLHPMDVDNREEDGDGGGSGALVEVRRTEWTQFRAKLGAAIAAGFREKCQRYAEVLRQLEHLRTLAQTDSIEARVHVLRHRQRLDLAYFFLVKESLAFTYQQMNLPAEAVMQYDELKAVLPELDPTVSHKRDDALSEVALQGDCQCFRERLRATENLIPLTPVLQEYVFARTTSLLFEMDKAVGVVGRCTAFIKSMYRYRSDQLKDETGDPRAATIGTSPHEQTRLDLESWAFNFCWDIKRACDLYLAEDVSESSAAAVLQAHEEFPRRTSAGSQSRRPHRPHRRTRRLDEALAKSVCNLVEFAGLRLFRIADLTLGGPSQNPLRASAGQVWARELERSWSPWKPGTCQQDESHTEEETEDGGEGESQGFLASAVVSPGSFVANYLTLLKVLESYNRFSGRERCAARLCVEIAGLHVLRGDLSQAATALRVAATTYADDGWDACHFLLLFRLAGYQRQVSTADDYLQTLVQCFGPDRNLSSAPPKALEALLCDLDSVLRSTWVSRKRLTAIPCFDPVMGLEGFKPSGRTGSARDLLKKIYNVGDKATISIAVESFLPKEVEVDAISVDLVPFQAYVSAMEDSTNVKEEDLLTVLRLPGPVALRPGANEFDIYWVPMFAGQFILGSTTITWKSIRISYAAADLKRPVMRIDVVPSIPTQSAALLPNYLLPGHEQPVTLSFSAGTDVVRQGSVKFVCSPGLQLVLRSTAHHTRSEDEDWLSSIDIPLPECTPGETVKVEVLVKCNAAEDSKSDVGSRSLHAHVQTHYRPPLPPDSMCTSQEEEYANDRMAEHQIDTAISAINAQSLSIDRLDLIPYAQGRALLEVKVKCNIPSSFVLRRWEITLPSFLKVLSDDERGGLNACVRGASVTAGEVFHLSFDCEFTNTEAVSSEPPRLMFVLDDGSGNMFDEKLPLNLRRPAAASPEQIHDATRTKQALAIEVNPSCSDGSVGLPSLLEYTIAMTDILGMATTDSSCYRYKLQWDPSDWSISGPVEGPLPNVNSIAEPCDSQDTCTIVSVMVSPNRPGNVPRFPSLRVFMAHPGIPGVGDDPELYLEVTTKANSLTKASSFFARPAPSQTAVASLAAGPSRKSIVVSNS